MTIKKMQDAVGEFIFKYYLSIVVVAVGAFLAIAAWSFADYAVSHSPQCTHCEHWSHAGQCIEFNKYANARCACGAAVEAEKR